MDRKIGKTNFLVSKTIHETLQNVLETLNIDAAVQISITDFTEGEDIVNTVIGADIRLMSDDKNTQIFRYSEKTGKWNPGVSYQNSFIASIMDEALRDIISSMAKRVFDKLDIYDSVPVKETC